MKTKNECTQDGNLCNGSLTTEVMNNESITEKIRQTMEEWNEQGKTSKLNKFRSPVTNALSVKSARPASRSLTEGRSRFQGVIWRAGWPDQSVSFE